MKSDPAPAVVTAVGEGEEPARGLCQLEREGRLEHGSWEEGSGPGEVLPAGR